MKLVKFKMFKFFLGEFKMFKCVLFLAIINGSPLVACFRNVLNKYREHKNAMTMTHEQQMPY